MDHLIVIEKSAWNDLLGRVSNLSDNVAALVKDRTQPDILTHKEAAAYIGYSSTRLHELKGVDIPYSQNSRKITYRLEDLDKFLRDRRIEKRKT